MAEFTSKGQGKNDASMYYTWPEVGYYSLNFLLSTESFKTRFNIYD